jgi:hypothetical protein
MFVDLKDGFPKEKLYKTKMATKFKMATNQMIFLKNTLAVIMFVGLVIRFLISFDLK